MRLRHSPSQPFPEHIKHRLHRGYGKYDGISSYMLVFAFIFAVYFSP
jgi:hypothetical protein